MKNTNVKKSACSILKELRGSYKHEPQMYEELSIAGTILTPGQEKIYILENDISKELELSTSPYHLITEADVYERQNSKFVLIKKVLSLEQLDSTGQMCCGF